MDLDVEAVPFPVGQFFVIGQVGSQEPFEGTPGQLCFQVDVGILTRVVHDQSVRTFLQVLDFLFEVAVARDVHLVELVFVYEVLCHFSQVLIGRPVELARVCEEQSAFFEGKRANLLEFVGSPDLLYGPFKELVDY